MSFGRFIIECDPANFILAGRAAEYLQTHPECKEALTAFGQGTSEIQMFSKRLKRSIRVQQVKP